MLIYDIETTGGICDFFIQEEEKYLGVQECKRLSSGGAYN